MTVAYKLFLCELFFVAMFCGCTGIWEDRIACPAWIELTLGENKTSVDNLCVWIYDDEGVLILKDSLAEESLGHFYLPHRGQLECYAWGNIGKGTVASGDELKVRGDNIDPLYFSHTPVFIKEDTLRVSIDLHRQYAIVTVLFIGLDMPERGKLVFSSASSGYTLDGLPLPGGYSATYSTDSTSMLSFRMLRQSTFDGLFFKFRVDENGGQEREFEMGKYLQEMGYDMDSSDLQDINISIDLTHRTITIESGSWQMCVPFYVEF